MNKSSECFEHFFQNMWCWKNRSSTCRMLLKTFLWLLCITDLTLDLASRKIKDFEIQIPWRNKWLQNYITLQMKVRCRKWQILLVSWNRQFQKLSGVFCFYFRKFFPCIYLTKQLHYFPNKKSYRTSLFIES